MKCKGWQQLRANAKNGISMALVLCVSAFFIAFAINWQKVIQMC